MTVESKLVRVICPICRQENSVDIPEFLLAEAQDGVLKVQIPMGAACPEHSFMVYIDKKFAVRGYQSVDIEFTVPAPVVEGKDEDETDFDINGIIAALGSDITATILRAILVDKPVLFVESFDLNDRINKAVKFLHEMESEDLVITSEKVKREDLKGKTVRKSGALVVAPLYRALVRSPFMIDINTRFESDLLKSTTKIPDRKSQIIFLRRELIKIRTIIDEFVKALENADKFYEEDIPAYTRDSFNYRMDMKNIDVMKEIIEFKYSPKLARKIINKSLDKIRTDLW